jgi:hypothetical protein
MLGIKKAIVGKACRDLRCVVVIKRALLEEGRGAQKFVIAPDLLLNRAFDVLTVDGT